MGQLHDNNGVEGCRRVQVVECCGGEGLSAATPPGFALVSQEQ